MIVARAAAHLAVHVDVRQEEHGDLDGPGTAARLAAPALDIETEATRFVAADVRLRQSREELPDEEEHKIGRAHV